MSVIPLSSLDRDSGEGAPDTTTNERPGAFDHNGAATKAVDAAVEKLFAVEDVNKSATLINCSIKISTNASPENSPSPFSPRFK